MYFPVVEEVDEDIARGLAGANGLRYCHAKSAETADHREGSDKSRKKLYWVMAWGTACEANTIMARIILEELVPKFYDMALLEELHRHSGEKLLFQGYLSCGGRVGGRHDQCDPVMCGWRGRSKISGY